MSVIVTCFDYIMDELPLLAAFLFLWMGASPILLFVMSVTLDDTHRRRVAILLWLSLATIVPWILLLLYAAAEGMLLQLILGLIFGLGLMWMAWSMLSY